MNKKDLYRAIGNIDDEYTVVKRRNNGTVNHENIEVVNEAEGGNAMVVSVRRRKILPHLLAAVLILAVGVSVAVAVGTGLQKDNDINDETIQNEEIADENEELIEENHDEDTQNEDASDDMIPDDDNMNGQASCIYEMNPDTGEYELVFVCTDENNTVPEFAEDFQNPEVIPWSVETALDEISDYLMETNNLDTRDHGTVMFANGGYRLYLTTDRKLQTYLDDKYKDWYYFPESLSNEGDMIQSAIAVMDYEGHILGVEGKIGEKAAEDNRGFNFAYEGGRHIGSAITPVTVYGYAVENGLLTPETEFYDEPLSLGIIPDVDYWPRNFDGAPSGGYYPAKYFFKQSINTLPAQILYNNGNSLVEEIYDFATKKLHLDLEPEDADYAPLAMGWTYTGPGLINLANAYMPYGNGGRYYKASIISRLEDAETGEILIDNENRDYEQAVSEETAYIMNDMLSEVIRNGTGTAASLENAPVAGKTGAVEDWRDLTFVGLTPDYVSAMWIGYDLGGNSWAIESINSAGLWKNVFGDYADENWSGASFPK